MLGLLCPYYIFQSYFGIPAERKETSGNKTLGGEQNDECRIFPHGLGIVPEKQCLMIILNSTMFRAGRKQLWKRSIGRVIQVRKTEF